MIHKIGRRKSSVARVYIKKGTGNFQVNGRTIEKYFTTDSAKYKIKQAFMIIEHSYNLYDISVNVHGGGVTGQVEAIRLGIARALISIDKEFKKSLKSAGLLTRDPRMVERKKFGQKKARKKFQFSKR